MSTNDRSSPAKEPAMTKATIIAAFALTLLPLTSPARAEVVTDQSRILVSVPQIPSSARTGTPISRQTMPIFHLTALD
jgi:hypothetical protein